MGFDTSFDPIFLVVLALPGFVAVGVYDSLVPSTRRTTGKSILEVVLFGTMNAVLTAPLWLWMSRTWAPGLEWREFWLLWGAVLFAGMVMPILLAVATAKLPKWSRIRPHVLDPTPTAWDAAMERREEYFVRFHMKDGRVIGGYFGGASFASSYPHPPDMYVQELWFLDDAGAFVEAAPNSRGVVIRADECNLIELIAYRSSDATATAEQTQPEAESPGRLPSEAEHGTPSGPSGPEPDPAETGPEPPEG